MSNPKELNLQPGAILFGAGGSGHNFIRNTGMRPAAVVDNDAAKWGTSIGATTIQSPEDVRWSDVSQVVVASGAVVAIRQQLLDLGVDSDAIVVPPTWLLGNLPLRDERDRDYVLDIVATLMESKDLAFPVVAGWGTALGLVRESDLIAWDYDVDLYAFIPDKTKICKTLGRGVKDQERDNTFHFAIILPSGKQLNMTVGFFPPNATSLTEFLYYKRWEFNTKRFLNPASKIIGGRKFFVPENPEEYLAAIYGRDWDQPRPDFTALDYGL